MYNMYMYLYAVYEHIQYRNTILAGLWYHLSIVSTLWAKFEASWPSDHKKKWLETFYKREY